MNELEYSMEDDEQQWQELILEQLVLEESLEDDIISQDSLDRANDMIKELSK